MRTVLIALFDGVQSLDVTGPREAFAGALTETGEPGNAGSPETAPAHLVAAARAASRFAETRA